MKHLKTFESYETINEQKQIIDGLKDILDGDEVNEIQSLISKYNSEIMKSMKKENSRFDEEVRHDYQQDDNRRYLNTYKKFNEALLPSQFRKYVSEFNKDRYEKKFQEFKEKYDGDRNAYRIYLPIDIKSDKSETQIEIEKTLSENGYEVIDYISGSAKYKDAKNPSKIGKVLTSLASKSDEKENIEKMMKKFIEDPIRKSGKEEMLVCISRHPYDIAGADTDRKWTNCMTIGTKTSKKIETLTTELSKLDKNDVIQRDKIREIKDKIDDLKDDGENVKYLLQDVKEGSLIAYLIKSTDKNINDPIANLNIKPYMNISDKKDFILLSDSKMYGRGNEKFKEVVDDFLKEFNNKKEGLYSLSDKVYSDYNDDELVAHNIDITKGLNDFIEKSEKFNGKTIYLIFEECDKKIRRENGSIIDYIVENINISKILNALDYKNLANKRINSHDEGNLTEWIMRLLLKISIKMERYDIIIQLLNVKQTSSYDDNYDFIDDDIYRLFREIDNKEMLEAITKKWNLTEFFIENEDHESFEKLIKVTNAKFSMMDMDDHYLIKTSLSDETYEFYSDVVYNKLLKNPNIVSAKNK